MEIKAIAYDLGTVGLSIYQMLRNNETAERESARAFELAQKRLDVQREEAKRDSEVVAMIAAKEAANNQQLWKIVSFMTGAVGISLIAVGVTRLFKKGK